MLKSHEKFHSANGKRLVLVVDDELVNRELLGLILQNDYEVLYAESGEEALGIIRENEKTLSLILLDLLMPGMHGLELLHILQGDAELQWIPVVVMTSEKSAEVESLRVGAADFIAKPYDLPEVILARMQRIIELNEDRRIIQSTERDVLTGLYNREYFYRYAEQYDVHHGDQVMDAIVINVNRFHTLNERYGKTYGDGVLRRIGEKVREMVRDSGGIVCWREADTFLVYCPHREDYQAILAWATVGLRGEQPVAAGNSQVRLRMGVYSGCDKTIDIERRFDRAKMAADTVRNNYTRSVAYYDAELHRKEMFAERLLEDVDAAIEEGQFQVYYQPKFNIRGERPRLAGAEALIRWQHPEYGMVSPGIFIPLLEDNGLIQRLDEFVWRTAARQIRAWRDALGVTVPVSVNVSRIDMYDPHLVETIRAIVTDNGLEPRDYLLEITESAYTEDSEQIINTAKALRSLGFRVEMDDFGTGYSSLNMLSSLPIDALKLDMKFIRNAQADRRDVRMLELMVDIARYLGVPVIAEGVETEEQLHMLRELGCDMVQGYYFSRPVPAEEFIRFIQEEISC